MWADFRAEHQELVQRLERARGCVELLPPLALSGREDGAEEGATSRS